MPPAETQEHRPRPPVLDQQQIDGQQLRVQRRGERRPTTRTPRLIEPSRAITVDHPSGGDVWVVHRTARRGNVVGADAAVRQQARAFRGNAERSRKWVLSEIE